MINFDQLFKEKINNSQDFNNISDEECFLNAVMALESDLGKEVVSANLGKESGSQLSIRMILDYLKSVNLISKSYIPSEEAHGKIVFKFIQSSNLLSKMIISDKFELNEEKSWTFYIKQLKDPKNYRPVVDLPNGVDRNQYRNPKKGKKFLSRKASKNRGAPKDTDKIKKTSVTVIPKKGKYVAYRRIGNHGENTMGVGMLFIISNCDLKDEKYIFKENADTNSRWWLKGAHEYYFIKSISLIDLIDYLDEVERRGGIPKWNEALVCPSKKSILGISISENDLQTRLNAQFRKRYVELELNLTNLPMLIISSSYNEETCIYNKSDQLFDLIIAESMPNNTLENRLFHKILNGIDLKQVFKAYCSKSNDDVMIRLLLRLCKKNMFSYTDIILANHPNAADWIINNLSQKNQLAYLHHFTLKEPLNGNYNKTRYLIEKSPGFSEQDKGELGRVLLRLVRAKQYDIVGKLIDKSPSISTTWVAGKKGTTALHILMKSDQIDLAKRLVKKYKASCLNKDSNNDTEFSIALNNYLMSSEHVKKTHEEFVNFLIQHTDLSLYPTPDLFPLLVKVIDRDEEIVKKILSRCSANQLKNFLCYAVSKEHERLCQIIMQRLKLRFSFDVLSKSNNLKRSPLQIAMDNKNYNIIALLIRQTDNFGDVRKHGLLFCKLLSLLVKNEQYDLVEHLLKKSYQSKVTHIQALHTLLLLNKFDLARSLISRYKPSIVDKDNHGRTPFSIAVEGYLSSNQSSIEEWEAVLKRILQYGNMEEYPAIDLFPLLVKLQNKNSRQWIREILYKCKNEQFNNILSHAIVNKNTLLAREVVAVWKLRGFFDILSDNNSAKKSPLEQAMRNLDTDMLNLLIDQSHTFQNSRKNTKLLGKLFLILVDSKKYVMAKKLLNKSPGMSLEWYSRDNKNTVLHYLIEDGQIELAESILKKYKVLAAIKNADTETIFSMAVNKFLQNNQDSYYRLVKAMIQYGDFSTYPESDLFEVLMKLVPDHSDLVENILDKCGFEKFQVLLYLAVVGRKVDFVEIVMKAYKQRNGINLLAKVPGYNSSILSAAMKVNNCEILDFLIGGVSYFSRSNNTMLGKLLHQLLINESYLAAERLISKATTIYLTKKTACQLVKAAINCKQFSIANKILKGYRPFHGNFSSKDSLIDIMIRTDDYSGLRYFIKHSSVKKDKNDLIKAIKYLNDKDEIHLADFKDVKAGKRNYRRFLLVNFLSVRLESGQDIEKIFNELHKYYQQHDNDIYSTLKRQGAITFSFSKNTIGNSKVSTTYMKLFENFTIKQYRHKQSNSEALLDNKKESSIFSTAMTVLSNKSEYDLASKEKGISAWVENLSPF